MNSRSFPQNFKTSVIGKVCLTWIQFPTVQGDELSSATILVSVLLSLTRCFFACTSSCVVVIVVVVVLEET